MNGTKAPVMIAAWLALAALAACGPKAPPLTELSAEELWERGTAAYQEEEWEDAIRYFERYALVGGTDPRVGQARFNVASAHFQREQYVTAASEFARLASDLGRADLGAEARFMTCRAYEELSPKPQLDQEYTRAAIDHCSALVEYFPSNVRVDEANEIIARMWNKLAHKVYDAGDWYRGRRAYDSAILYFEDVVEQYPQTRWAPRALLRLVEIYGILEWDDEREEARQRLLSDYPDSEAAREVGGAASAS